MVTIETVLWMSFLLGMSVMVGDKIVTPLVEQAASQATLNAESLVLIEQALAVCEVQP